jgi:alpha-tubulin suppressor-like RCC1 family protein
MNDDPEASAMPAMTSSTAALLRALPTVLFCTTLTVAVSAVAWDGPVVGWGDDAYGLAILPDTINGRSGTATHISAGVNHSCAIQGGTDIVICWGANANGEATPPDVVNGVLGTATEITAGLFHSCAIQEGTGIVICWGANANGEATPPNAVNGISGTATRIAAGSNHSCAIQAGTGEVVCWGGDSEGQATPSDAVNGILGTATNIVAGGNHSCAIQADTDIVVCWGNDSHDQATPPDAVNGISGTATDIAAGGRHSCGIQAGTGNVVCWGADGEATTPPDDVNGVTGTAAAIAAGYYHSCAIQEGTGDVFCWGSDYDGSGNYVGQSTPPDAVNGVSGTATGIAAGGYHSLAIAFPGPPLMLTKRQQTCVKEMNKRAERANKAQLRVNQRCLRYYQRERLAAPTFDICTADDETNWVRNAEAKTEEGEQKKCDRLSEPPPFAYTDFETVNTAAVDGALALTYKIFGGPSELDDIFFTRAEDAETAKCQLEMLKRGDILENTILKEINKEKKKAIKDEAVDNAAALEERLQAVFSSNKRINNTQDRLVKWVDRKCAVLRPPPATIFPGQCAAGDPNLRQVEVCVIYLARCEACVMINAFDDLNLDCDRADDQDVNGSCPAADGKGVSNHQQLTNAHCFPSSVLDSASQLAKTCIALANSAPDMVFTPADYQGLPEDCKPLVNSICR